MLRVAVPNKGALSESAGTVLAEAGYRKRSDSKDLTVLDTANDVEPGEAKAPNHDVARAAALRELRQRGWPLPKARAR